MPVTREFIVRYGLNKGWWTDLANYPPALCCQYDCKESNGFTQYTFNSPLICDWCKQRLRQEGGRGSSRDSLSKEMRILNGVKDSIRLSRGSSLIDKPFWYVSLHCGWSHNWKDCIGEAVQGIQELELNKRLYNARLCDISADYVFELMCWIRYHRYPRLAGSTIQYYAMNNRQFLPMVVEEIGHTDNPRNPRRGLFHAPGCLVIDPNGPSQRSVPYDLLQWLHPQVSKLDWIWNINYGSIWRCVRCKGGQHTRSWFFQSVRELLDMFPGRVWVLSEPLEGPNSYVLAIGRCIVANHSRGYGFYSLNSAEGQRILSLVNKDEERSKLCL